MRVLITAGPTREAIDPVRFLSNNSTGKMGFAMAAAARDAGFEITLIAGPVSLETPEGVKRIDVVSARDMLAAVEGELPDIDIFISTAAVADYRPAEVLDQKFKKSGDDWSLKLVRNPDILATVSARSDRPFCVGFAAETEKHLEHGRDKLARKSLDMIAINDVSDAGIGFGSAYNALHVCWKGHERVIEKAPKAEVARELVRLIEEVYAQRSTQGTE